MPELKTTLLNLRRLRDFAHDVPTNELEEALEKLTAIVKERRSLEEIQLAEVKRRIQRDGLDAQALISALSNLEKMQMKQIKGSTEYKHNRTTNTWLERESTTSDIPHLGGEKPTEDFGWLGYF